MKASPVPEATSTRPVQASQAPKPLGPSPVHSLYFFLRGGEVTNPPCRPSISGSFARPDQFLPPQSRSSKSHLPCYRTSQFRPCITQILSQTTVEWDDLATHSTTTRIPPPVLPIGITNVRPISRATFGDDTLVRSPPPPRFPLGLGNRWFRLRSTDPRPAGDRHRHHRRPPRGSARTHHRPHDALSTPIANAVAFDRQLPLRPGSRSARGPSSASCNRGRGARCRPRIAVRGIPAEPWESRLGRVPCTADRREPAKGANPPGCSLSLLIRQHPLTSA